MEANDPGSATAGRLVERPRLAGGLPRLVEGDYPRRKGDH
jgi:hypothetical protein